MAVLLESKLEKRTNYWFFCPGCKENHCFTVRQDGGRPAWNFNGNFEVPTFTPSLLYPDRVCHLFLTNGQIQFLGDCSHELAGQTVGMQEITEIW